MNRHPGMTARFKRILWSGIAAGSMVLSGCSDVAVHGGTGYGYRGYYDPYPRWGTTVVVDDWRYAPRRPAYRPPAYRPPSGRPPGYRPPGNRPSGGMGRPRPSGAGMRGRR